MIFDLTLYASLLIFLLGVIYKVSGWFRTTVGLSPVGIRPSVRFAAALRGILSAVISTKSVTLVKVFLWDILLQFRILRDKQDPFIWIIHICIYGGITLLVLMHALDKFITAGLFEEYNSTLNPFLFLRNVFGAVVLLGLIMAVARRIRSRGSDVTTGPSDIFVIAMLAVIILSGFLLEGAKIGSYSAYEEMREDFASYLSHEEARALEALWVKEFGVASPRDFANVTPEVLEQGRELSEMSCAPCHSNPKWAFLSYGASAVTRPVALSLDRSGYPKMLWYLHFLSCFFALAYIPFSKLFHIIATPVSLLVNATTDENASNPASIATRNSIELDGCKHGGACHDGCEIQKKRQMQLNKASKRDPFLALFGKMLHMKNRE